ncbi:MAG TPA: SIMPL domain-containing protein [Actinomycetota bacterium]|nr:SIMPL domain-containing protein [Actinomycetota bacterium]
MKLLIAGLVGALVGAFAAPLPAAAQDSEPLINTVTVAAFKEVDIEPDIGTITFGVTSHAREADAAIDKLSTRTERVIDAIKALGYTGDNIDTFNVELQRTCLDRCRDPNPKDDVIPQPVIGYRGAAGIRVETSELKRLGEVIDVGIGAGAKGVRGISFDVSDRSEAVKEALRQAMVFATDKARILAETGGRTLGPAILISEGRTRAPEIHHVGADAIAGTTSAGGTVGRPRRPTNPFPVEPPTLSASARVQVTFTLI